MVLNWGIIGCGAIAEKTTAQAMIDAPPSKLVAAMRRDVDKCREFAEKWGVPNQYSTVENILEDDEVNAVYVATPICVHREQTIAAAEAGKHVLVEKPMAMTAAECQEMIDACDANKVKLAVCFYQRFNARHQQMRDMIADGLIGRVVAARIQFSQYYPDIDGAWRQIPEQGGGGTVMDTGSHCIDTLSMILGAKATEVSAFTSTVAFSYPVDDTASILLKFDNGVQGVVTSYFSSPDVDPASVNIIDVYGTKGRIVAAPINAKNSEGFLKAYTEDAWNEHYVEQNTHVALLEAFADCVEVDGPSPVSGEDGLMGMRIIEAVYRSSETGRTVKI